MSGRTYEKAKEVVKAAAEDPDRFGHLVEQMDETGNVDAAYSKVNRAKKHQAIAELSNANAPLPRDRRYPVILADPPWQYDHPYSASRAIENHYPTMSIEEICALDVASLCTPDAMLFLWVPAPLLPEGIRVVGAWGFGYRTHGVWNKQRIGMGIYLRQQHETFFVASRGTSITPDPSTLSPSIIEAVRGRHSEKPVELYEIIERYYPTLPKIELFSRRSREGWRAWGNEAAEAA
jgi:N6-adenosine-specific RNA methylase IME4